MLGVLVPISVVSHFVNKNISKESNSPVLSARPPRVVLVEFGSSILIIDDFVLLSVLRDSSGALKLRIETWLMSIRERQFILSIS